MSSKAFSSIKVFVHDRGRMLGIWQAQKGRRKVLHCHSFVTKNALLFRHFLYTLCCTINLLRKVYNLNSIWDLPKAERCLPSPRWIPRVGWWKLFLIVPSLGSERKECEPKKHSWSINLPAACSIQFPYQQVRAQKNSDTSFPSSFWNLFYYAYIP